MSWVSSRGQPGSPQLLTQRGSCRPRGLWADGPSGVDRPELLKVTVKVTAWPARDRVHPPTSSYLHSPARDTCSVETGVPKLRQGCCPTDWLWPYSGTSVTYLLIHVSIHPSIHLSTHPSISLFLPLHSSPHPSVHPFLSLPASISPLIFSSTHLPVHPPVCPSVHRFTSIHASVHSSIRPSIHPTIHPVVQQTFSVSGTEDVQISEAWSPGLKETILWQGLSWSPSPQLSL